MENSPLTVEDNSKEKDYQYRGAAPEANQLHGKKVSPERIGRVLMTAEDTPATRADKKLEKQSQTVTKDRRAETMSRAELLDLSEKVAVENTTLRQVYETHLVSEQGLRRLVNEYIHGGDVQKALRQELIEHEIDFERDPMLRDQTKPAATLANNETLSYLLQKADTFSDTQTKDELTVLKARQVHHESQRQHRQRRRRILDVSMAVAIAVLFVLVLMLLMRGR